jgi:dihydroneopterin aldolase/2-amino-4-hydroxy-6-hydroxymethyldihydropteridine diphosphokinase
VTRAFIAVGSNIDPEHNVLQGLRALAQTARVAGISTLYRTPPIDRPDQQPFINGVVEILTDLSPEDLRQLLRAVEAQLGRVRTEDKYAARPLDLDLIVYNGLVRRNPPLVLPDPDIYRRPFLAVPLCELAPNLLLPDTGRRVADVAAHLDATEMTALPEYTQQVRTEVLYGQKESRGSDSGVAP